MFLELVVTILIAVYIVIVALGHVLLVSAVFRYLREEWPGGGRQLMTAVGSTPGYDKQDLLLGRRYPSPAATREPAPATAAPFRVADERLGPDPVGPVISLSQVPSAPGPLS